MMSSEGEVQWVGVDTGEEFPSGQAVIEGLTAAFQERAASGEIRAAASCYDALAIPPGGTNKVDVIGFALERQ